MLGLILFAPVSSVADPWGGGARGRHFVLLRDRILSYKQQTFLAPPAQTCKTVTFCTGPQKCAIFSCFLQLFQKLLILGWLCKIGFVFCALCVHNFVVFMRKKSIKVQPPPLHDRSLDPPLYHRSAMRDTAHVRVCNTLCNTIFIDSVSSVRNKPNA